jgi:hypothetical protein
MPERPRRLRRLAFVSLALAIGWGLIELCAVLAFGPLFGEGYAPSRLQAERAALAAPAEAPADARQIANTTNWVLHPYLGYVIDPEHPDSQRGAGGLQVSDWGFFDEGPPFRERGPDEFVIALLGGSVAAMFAEDGAGPLAEALRREPGLDDRRIVFVRLANPGYRQPQQKIALDLALAQGGAFDAVLCLDGLNELTQPLKKGAMAGVHPLYPSNWQFLAADALDPAVQRAIGGATFCRAMRRDLAVWFEASWLAWSPLANLGWKIADRTLEHRIAGYAEAARAAAEGPRPYAVTGPAIDGWTDAERLRYGADVWAQCAEMIHQTCAARGIASFHLLQPNQYVAGSKPMGPAERAVARHDEHPVRMPVEQGYPLLQERGRALAARGVAFHDLTGVFAGVEEPLYVDPCCHLSPRGSALLAEAIARIVGPTLAAGAGAGAPAEVRALRAEPARLVFDQPFARGRMRVRGELPSGAEVDLGYACRDFVSDRPEVVAVDGYGGLVARGPGTARVTARFAGREVALEVEVRFAEVAVLDNESPRAEAPALRGRVVEGRLEAWLDPAPRGAATGWLVIGTAPMRSRFCRETLYVDLGRGEKLPIAGGSDEVRWDLPLDPALRGATFFAQAFLVDPSARCRLHSTNGLAVTPR